MAEKRKGILTAIGAETVALMAIEILARHPEEEARGVSAAEVADLLDGVAVSIRWIARREAELEKRMAESRERLCKFVCDEGFIEDPGDDLT